MAQRISSNPDFERPEITPDSASELLVQALKLANRGPMRDLKKFIVDHTDEISRIQKQSRRKSREQWAMGVIYVGKKHGTRRNNEDN